MKLSKIAVKSLLILSIITCLLALLVWALNFYPDDIQKEEIFSNGSAPILKSGQNIKILSYNVQYMAGKNYVFFYDLLDGSGPDTRPTSEDITTTFGEVARIINEEDPDIILLQEMHDGASATDYEDQLQRLLPMISKDYLVHTSAFYWKSVFVPHPKVMGAAGMKLSIISKYKISNSTRHQLAIIPDDIVSRQFSFKRAILEARMPVEGGKDLVVMDTHFDAFSQGTDTMQQQVKYLDKLLNSRVKEGISWLIGGDFNLLPPHQYEILSEKEQAYYQPQTEFKKIYDQFPVIPSLEDLKPPNTEKWFTHFPNSFTIKAPNKTIDFIVHSPNLTLKTSEVRQHDTLQISDHLPMIAEFTLPR